MKKRSLLGLVGGYRVGSSRGLCTLQVHLFRKAPTSKPSYRTQEHHSQVGSRLATSCSHTSTFPPPICVCLSISKHRVPGLESLRLSCSIGNTTPSYYSLPVIRSSSNSIGTRVKGVFDPRPAPYSQAGRGTTLDTAFGLHWIKIFL